MFLPLTLAEITAGIVCGSETAERGTQCTHCVVTFQQRQRFFCDGNRPLSNSLPFRYSGWGNSEYSISS